ncbi:hypothetical protein HC251_08905 [Iamia sp. SCSIO 61187]|uniref:DUF5655 domain-containing protein n=1 Tax=Iamia sp. SCSIO 61187 TaxID=2722752 RepID=UPI001C62E6DF|nr:DUF5655 domain-containing protein [Iamia sp. SCSIO 61187]QYG92550.1 hypothetical protein HC251_08905 [Iamia sp. SCSIO 61187]
MAWTCPACDRTFGRTGQSHMCVPVVSLDEWFADRPPVQRQVCDAVVGHLETLGEVDVEAAQVGILIKRDRTFAELRPHRGHLRLSVVLDHDVESPRIARRISPTRQFRRYVLYVVLPTPDEVDDEVRGWLTESFETA